MKYGLDKCVRLRILICIMAFGNISGAHAFESDTIKYVNASEDKVIGKQVSYLEDTSFNLTINDILFDKTQEGFQRHNKDVFSRPATQSAYWYKIKCANYTNKDLLLEVSSTYAWYIDFYISDSLGAISEEIQTGTIRPEKNKKYDVNLFWLPLNSANDTIVRTYYLRIKSGLTYELPLIVGTVETLSKRKDLHDYLTAGFIGLILVMFLYNLFIYLSTKESIYIYYLGYLLLMGLSMPYANNYPFIQHIDFWFFNKTWWNENFLLWHCPVYYFIGEFCIRYLNLKHNGPIIRRVLQFEILILGLGIPFLTIIGVQFVDLVNITQTLIVIFYLTCLITGYYFAIKKVKQALFYVLGWTFMVMGAITFFASANGFLPYNPILRNVLYFGAAIEVWMFSLALANRLNILQAEKELVQNENLSLVKNQNILLEQKVNERTEELTAINDELLQKNDTLIKTTEALDAQSEQLKELNSTKNQVFAVLSHDLRSPLITLKNVLYLINEDLISYDEFKNILGKAGRDIENLSFTLNNLLKWAVSQMNKLRIIPEEFLLIDHSKEIEEMLVGVCNTKSITIDVNICDKQRVFTDPEINRLIIRNLMNNAVKFTPEGGKITMSSECENGLCILSIKDSGIGMGTEHVKRLFERKNIDSQPGTSGEKGTGIGLMICHEFANKAGGNIWVKSELGKGSTFYYAIPSNENSFIKYSQTKNSIKVTGLEK